jgi:hypothetical protein
MHGLAEPNFLQACGGGFPGNSQRSQRRTRCDRRGRGQEIAAADAGADIDKMADVICHGSGSSLNEWMATAQS